MAGTQTSSFSLDNFIGQLQDVFEKLYAEKEEGEVIDINTTYEVWCDSFKEEN